MAHAIAAGNSAGTNQVFDPIGKQGAVGNLKVASGGGQNENAIPVNKLGEDANAVVKAPLLTNIVLGHVVVGINLARVSNAQSHTKVTKFGTLTAGHKLL